MNLVQQQAPHKKTNGHGRALLVLPFVVFVVDRGLKVATQSYIASYAHLCMHIANYTLYLYTQAYANVFRNKMFIRPHNLHGIFLVMQLEKRPKTLRLRRRWELIFISGADIIALGN